MPWKMCFAQCPNRLGGCYNIEIENKETLMAGRSRRRARRRARSNRRAQRRQRRDCRRFGGNFC